jgi:hypothetical protein
MRSGKLVELPHLLGCVDDHGGLWHALAGRMLHDGINECGGLTVDRPDGQAGEQRPRPPRTPSAPGGSLRRIERD